MFLTTNAKQRYRGVRPLPASKLALPVGKLALPVMLAYFATLAIPGTPGRAQTAKLVKDTPSTDIHPLALKEEMIRDRFKRFEDRIYRLREQLAETEPDNAAKLARVLQRAGELGLAEQLDDLIEILHRPSALPGALDTQAKWLADADRLLAILLERDSENQERREEIDRLEEYNKKLADLLAQEKALRSATGQGSLAERMLSQINESIRRIDALMKRQEDLSKKTKEGAAASQGERQGEKRASEQESLSEDTKQLAEDLERLGDLKPEADRDSPELESAREKTKSAAQSAQEGAGKMSKAGEEMQQEGGGSPSGQQQQAEEALKEAREKLEQAKKELENRPGAQEQAEQQEKIAEETEQLSQQMQQDASSEGGQGSPSPPTPGQQSVQKAQEEMQKAAQALKESKSDDAAQSEDQAIDQLEQAKKELEEALAQLRQEEREEVLRDLEVRFRDLLAKQRGINDGTVLLDQFGSEDFGREHHLQLAELSTKQKNLAADAEVCRHILDEDGSTVVFPRVLEQLGEDMTTVSLRLAAFKVASLTQTIEGEIIDTLEQLLEALQQMQQENEQQQQGQSQEGDPEDSPLLPPSAELKLLRAVQQRVNTRTSAVADAREEKSDTEASLVATLRAISIRQRECGQIAEEMHGLQE